MALLPLVHGPLGGRLLWTAGRERIHAAIGGPRGPGPNVLTTWEAERLLRIAAETVAPRTPHRLTAELLLPANINPLTASSSQDPHGRYIDNNTDEHMAYSCASSTHGPEIRRHVPKFPTCNPLPPPTNAPLLLAGTQAPLTFLLWWQALISETLPFKPMAVGADPTINIRLTRSTPGAPLPAPIRQGIFVLTRAMARALRATLPPRTAVEAVPCILSNYLRARILATSKGR